MLWKEGVDKVIQHLVEYVVPPVCCRATPLGGTRVGGIVTRIVTSTRPTARPPIHLPGKPEQLVPDVAPGTCRQDDQSLAIDVLPTLTLEIKQNGRSHKNSTPTDQRATMPACLEMLPLIKSLVNCAYEE